AVARPWRPARRGGARGRAGHPPPRAVAAIGARPPLEAPDRAAERRQKRMRVAMAAVGLAIVALLGFLFAPSLKRKLGGGLGKEARAKVEAAHGKLLLDDAGSLEESAKLFREAARLAPGEA